MKKANKKKLKAFKAEWLVSPAELERRVQLIDKEVLDYISEIPALGKYFKYEPVQNIISNTYYIARFSKISDAMLLNCVEAGFRFIMFTKDESQKEEIDTLLFPVFDVINEYAENDLYLDYLIDSEIVGDEKVMLGNIEVPMSKKALKIHIKNRMNSFFKLKPIDIAEAQNDLIEYKTNQFKGKSISQPNELEETDAENKTDSKNVINAHLNNSLAEYGFWDLEKVKELLDEQRNNLLLLLANNDLPYQVAMLNMLGFIDYLDKNYCKTNTQLFNKLSLILNRPARSIAGNIRSFNKNSGDRKEYSAYQHVEDVAKDFTAL